VEVRPSFVIFLHSRFITLAASVAHTIECGLGSGVREALLADEITSRLPQLYGGPDLTECWIAYAERPVRGLGSSCVVLISKMTGLLLYAGSANHRRIRPEVYTSLGCVHLIVLHHATGDCRLHVRGRRPSARNSTGGRLYDGHVARAGSSAANSD
jgi:hypothetical protein